MENFEIITKLGSGSFSKVYKVIRKIDNQIYALKKVNILNLCDKEKFSSLNEIRILASIKNKYVVGYKEAFLDESDSTLCLVMEYADRGDLSKRINEQKSKGKYFNEKDIWRIFIQLVKGLKALHDMNILHRDFKSSNIFLFSNGYAKIGDLNVSKIIGKNILCHTQTGTPFYAAPEVWQEKPYSFKSDIWSLGCVLYEMTTLNQPFRSGNMIKLYNKILKCEIGKLPEKFSEDLYILIKNMIQIDPDQRMSCNQILNCDLLCNRIAHYNKKSKNEKDLIIIHSDDEENEETNEDQLLKTIVMPSNIMYLSNQLPKPSYSQEIKIKNEFDQRNFHIKIRKNTDSLLLNNPNNFNSPLSSNNNTMNTMNEYQIRIKHNSQSTESVKKILSYQSYQQFNSETNIQHKKNNMRINLKPITTNHISELIKSQPQQIEKSNNNYENTQNNNNEESYKENQISEYNISPENSTRNKKQKLKSAFGLGLGDQKLKAMLSKKKPSKNHGCKKELKLKFKLKNANPNNNIIDNNKIYSSNMNNFDEYNNQIINEEKRPSLSPIQNLNSLPQVIDNGNENIIVNLNSIEVKNENNNLDHKLKVMNKWSSKLVLPKLKVTPIKRTLSHQINQNLLHKKEE